MNKYIDADKLKAEIERRITETEELGELERANELLILETFITPLQQDQPGEDLEKELEKYCRDYYNCNYPDQIQSGRCSPVMPHIVEAARHFYELGLNARKEK